MPPLLALDCVHIHTHMCVTCSSLLSYIESMVGAHLSPLDGCLYSFTVRRPHSGFRRLHFISVLMVSSFGPLGPSSSPGSVAVARWLVPVRLGRWLPSCWLPPGLAALFWGQYGHVRTRAWPAACRQGRSLDPNMPLIRLLVPHVGHAACFVCTA